MTRHNFRAEFVHMIVWAALAGLIEGQFASVVVSKTFLGSELLITIATATPFASQMFGLPWGLICSGRRKVRIATWFACGVTLSAGMIFVIPTTPLGALWFIAQVAAAQVLLCGVVTVRSAFWRANYPRTIRGTIIARLQAARFLVSAATTLSAAALSERDPLAFRYVYPAAALAGVIGILLLQRLHVRGERSELRRQRSLPDEPFLRRGMVEPFSLTTLLSPGHVFGAMIRVLREDHRFAIYTLAQFLIGTANLMTVPLVVVIVTRDLPIGDRGSFWISTALIVTLSRLTMFGSMGRWGRLFDRTGVGRFRVVNVTCWTLSLIFGLVGGLLVVDGGFVGPGTFLAAVGCFCAQAIMQGFGQGGGALAWNIGHLDYAKPDEAEVYMGVHVTLTGVRGLLAPLVGMALWNQLGWPVWVVWGIAILCAIGSLFIFHYLSIVEERNPHAPWKRS